MTRRLTLVVVAAAVVAVVALLTIVIDGGGETAATAEPPIAPSGIPPRPFGSERAGQPVEAEEARRVQLGLPRADAFGPRTPARPLAEFLGAWHDRAWDRMALWASASRRALPAETSALLRRRFGTFRLLGWLMLDSDVKARTARFRVLVAYRDLEPKVQRAVLTFVVNREDAAGRLVRTGGRWGVFLAERPGAGA